MNRSAALRIATAASRIAISVAFLVAATAAVVAAASLAPALRAWLGFSFAGVPRTPRAASDIATHNATIAAAPLCAAAAYPRLGTLARTTTSSALAALLVINAAAIGIALGAYGRRAADALLPHAVLELAAFSIAGGAYMQACQQRLSRGGLAAASCVSIALVTGAAAVEVLITNPGGRP